MLVIAPNAVRPEWAGHLESARLSFTSFNHAAPTRRPSAAPRRDLGAALESLGPWTPW
ncbi:MAG: hypothetical protein U0470_00490 [Anaerolineae bacterium]